MWTSKTDVRLYFFLFFRIPAKQVLMELLGLDFPKSSKEQANVSLNSDIVSSRTGSHTVEKHAMDVTVMNGAFLKTKIIYV